MASLLSSLMLLLSACADQAEQSNSTGQQQSNLADTETSVVAEDGVDAVDQAVDTQDNQGDELTTAALERSLLQASNRISAQQDDTLENQSVEQLQQLSEQDRAALRAQAAQQLMQAAQQKALEDAQSEADNRGPTN